MDRKRRALLSSVAGLAALSFVGCDSEPKPSATATLTNNEQVNEAVGGLVGASDRLASEVGRFDTDDWRDVVPDVRSAAEDVASAVQTLRGALGYSDAQ